MYASDSHVTRRTAGETPDCSALGSTKGWLLLAGEWQWPSAMYVTPPLPTLRVKPSARVLPSA